MKVLFAFFAVLAAAATVNANDPFAIHTAPGCKDLQTVLNVARMAAATDETEESQAEREALQEAKRALCSTLTPAACAWDTR